MTDWPRPLIETADLADRRADPRLRLFECTTVLAPRPDNSGDHYCDGGIAASSDALILTLLGAPDVAVYDNSLSEWARDPSLPMEP